MRSRIPTKCLAGATCSPARPVRRHCFLLSQNFNEKLIAQKCSIGHRSEYARARHEKRKEPELKLKCEFYCDWCATNERKKLCFRLNCSIQFALELSNSPPDFPPPIPVQLKPFSQSPRYNSHTQLSSEMSWKQLEMNLTLARSTSNRKWYD